MGKFAAPRIMKKEKMRIQILGNDIDRIWNLNICKKAGKYDSAYWHSNFQIIGDKFCVSAVLSQ